MPQKRFFTKERFFSDLQKSFVTQKPTLGDRVRSVIKRKRLPRR